jgi:hypothetical protein
MSGFGLLFQKSFFRFIWVGFFDVYICLFTLLQSEKSRRLIFWIHGCWSSYEDEQEQEACQEVSCFLSLGGYYEADSLSPRSLSQNKAGKCSAVSYVSYLCLSRVDLLVDFSSLGVWTTFVLSWLCRLQVFIWQGIYLGATVRSSSILASKGTFFALRSSWLLHLFSYIV